MGLNTYVEWKQKKSNNCAFVDVGQTDIALIGLTNLVHICLAQSRHFYEVFYFFSCMKFGKFFLLLHFRQQFSQLFKFSCKFVIDTIFIVYEGNISCNYR